MTNNPAKLVGIEGYGLEVVDRVPLKTQPHEANRHYLETKRTKMGHLLEEEDIAPVSNGKAASNGKTRNGAQSSLHELESEESG
jgi:hypothetical protein